MLVISKLCFAGILRTDDEERERFSGSDQFGQSMFLNLLDIVTAFAAPREEILVIHCGGESRLQLLAFLGRWASWLWQAGMAHELVSE